MTIDTDSATLTDQPLSTLDTPGGKDTVKKDESALDRLTGTTSDDRTAMFEDAREKLGEAVSSAGFSSPKPPKAQSCDGARSALSCWRIAVPLLTRADMVVKLSGSSVGRLLACGRNHTMPRDSASGFNLVSDPARNRGVIVATSRNDRDGCAAMVNAGSPSASGAADGRLAATGGIR